MKTKGKRIVLSTGAVAVVFLGIATYLGWPHLVFWYRFAPLGMNAQGFPAYRHRQTGIVFVKLPGGKFWMGAQKTDPSAPNFDPDAEDKEGPVHEVTLSPFLIGKYEVTQAQWKSVMGTNRWLVKGNDDLPVQSVSWENIQDFEAKTGLLLPAEEQWEYACRGGGPTPTGTGNLDDMGWYEANSGGTTHPVGKKCANGFGLHDMHGNVWEWCEDIAGSYYRVDRGGSYNSEAKVCRSSLRGCDDPAIRGVDLGFRPAYRLP